MADEDTTPNQPNTEEEEAQQSPPETPETPEEESKETSESTEEATDEAAEGEEQETEPEPAEEPEAKPPSRREQLRVQDLLRKYGPPKPRQPQQQTQPREAANLRDMIDADEEVYQQLEQANQQTAQQGYQQGQNEALQQMQTVEWRTMLHVDAPQVESKHKFLNPQDKENFHPALADAINTAYMNHVGFDEQTGLVNNPSVRYSDFVEGYVELANEMAGEMNRNTTKNITRQAAYTGLRPDGSQAKRMDLNKAPEDMSDEELEAYLKQAVPKK